MKNNCHNCTDIIPSDDTDEMNLTQVKMAFFAFLGAFVLFVCLNCTVYCLIWYCKIRYLHSQQRNGEYSLPSASASYLSKERVIVPVMIMDENDNDNETPIYCEHVREIK